MVDIPVYVTRKTGSGKTGDFALSGGSAVTIFLLVMLNILGWSIFGLVSLAVKVVEFLG